MGSGTGIGRVRGLGSAKTGSHHWMVQRTTAVGNLLLVTWLIVSLLKLPDYSYAMLHDWMAQPIVAVPAILMLISIFWHLRLGLQVFMEDYIHSDGAKFAWTLFLTFYAIGTAALGIFAIAKIAFTIVVPGTPPA